MCKKKQSAQNAKCKIVLTLVFRLFLVSSNRSVGQQALVYVQIKELVSDPKDVDLKAEI